MLPAPPHVEMGLDHDEEPEKVGQGWIGLKPDANQEAGQMGVPHHLLDDSVSPFGVG